MRPTPLGSPAVKQLRLVVATEDYDRAVGFYRDQLGLGQEETFTSDGGAQVMILDAGRATLELSNPAQIELIDRVEVGRTGVSGKYRVAFETDDAAAVTERLVAAGAELDRPTDPDAVELPQRAAERARRAAADDLHRTGRPV